MMRRATVAVAIGVGVVMAHAVQAQEQWSVELGAVGRYSIYDADVGVENGFGIVGGRGGLYVADNLSVEGEVTYGEPELSGGAAWQGRNYISHLLLQGRLVYTAWLSESTGLLLGAGFHHDNYSRARTVGARGWGGTGLLGLRYRFSEYISARIESTGHLVSEDPDTHVAPRPSTFNVGLQAGLSVVFGMREVERVVELPAPPPDTVIVTREVAPPLPQGTPTEICIATGENVTVYLTPQGDTLVGPNRVAISSLAPGVGFAGAYAEGRGWFEADEPFEFDGREYVQSGGEVGLDCTAIMQVGTHDGVQLFADVSASSPYETVYVPVRPGVWQAYQADLAAVRA
ncbi:MAG: outer membrane beta-barrel protein [Gammaproteobacteria bacterium]|nr:outer membrane beta-barrel protein [Gammaproteobacteria bacterium]